MNKESFATLTALIKKNFNILLRAKSSALIVILGPIFIIFFTGLAFDNSNLYAVKIGVYSPKYNDLSSSFLDSLSKNQFEVIKYLNEEECVSGIKNGEVHTCVIFPQDFAIGQDSSNKLDFYVDYSQINLVWTVLNVMTQRISSKSLELSKNLTAIIVNALDFTRSEVEKRKPSVVDITTQNDDSSRLIANIKTRFSSMELSVDPASFQLANLSGKKSTVSHWINNSLTIADESLNEAVKVLDEVGTFVEVSELDDDKKAEINSFLTDTFEDLGKLRDSLASTEELVAQEFEQFDATLSHVSGRITQIVALLDKAEMEKEAATEDLNTMQGLLDKSLSSIAEVQSTLNNIEHVINSIEITDPQKIVQPVVTNIKPVVAERSYLNYIFPIMIVLVIMFTALLLAPTLLLLEKNSPAYIRNFLTPTKDSTFILSAFFTISTVLFSQLAIILAIAAVFFSWQILTSFFKTLIVLVLLVSFFSFVGMIIGYLFKSEETATLAGVSLSTLLLFFSNVIIPIESMPKYLSSLAELNPFVLGGNLLRRTILFKASFLTLAGDLATMLVYSILACFVMVGIYYISKRDIFSKYLGKIGPIIPRRGK